MKKVIVGLVAGMFGFGAMACGGDPCAEAVKKCDGLKNNKEMCKTAAEMSKKAGADACKAFLKGFEQAKSAWEAAPEMPAAPKK